MTPSTRNTGEGHAHPAQLVVQRWVRDRPPRQLRAWAALVVALATLLAACSGAASDPESPAAIHDAPEPAPHVVYGAVPGLWRVDGSSDAEAVRQQLPRIAALGTTVLWLWPPAMHRELGEEYAIVDFTSLDPEWGTPEEVRRLIDDAHGFGMQVMVDFVANHTSMQHPWFAEATGPDDPSWGYYERTSDGSPTWYFDWEHLPNLDVDNQHVRVALTDALLGWMRDFGVDGFRLDAAWGPAERSEDFWSDLITALRTERADVILLAEADADDDWVAEAGFDWGYDWNGELGVGSWDEAWRSSAPAVELAAVLEGERDREGVPALRLLDTNDSGDRFADKHGLAMARVAAVLAFTVPGVPLVFAGQESGVAFEPYDLQSGGESSGNADAALEALYTELAELRRSTPALHSGTLDDVRVEGEILVFEREAVGDARHVVLLSFSETPATVTVPGADQLVLTTDPAATLAEESVTLPPGSGVVVSTSAS